MIRVGIIGAGAIASVHVDSYKRFPEQAVIVAVCDSFKNKAEKLIAEKSLKAVAYDDYTKLLADPKIDAVSLCLPPNLHCSATVKALNMGKHVLVEKPMASSLEECDRMIDAAHTNGKILSIVSQNRFKTPIARVRRMLENGELGRILYSNFESLWWRGQMYYDLWWRGTWAQECGGCMMSHAVHYLDLMHMFFGMPKRVWAVIANVGHDNSQCEDLGFALFDYNSMFVQFTCSLISHGERQGITIEGEKGSISIPWAVSASRPLPNGFPEDDIDQKEKLDASYHAIPELLVEGHDAQIWDFLNAIEEKKSVAIDGLEGKKTLELVMGIYKSAVMGAPITFPIAKEDPFYCKESMIAAMPKFHEKKKSVDNFSTSKITLGRDMGR
jgi:predicted dehydrogenase